MVVFLFQFIHHGHGIAFYGDETVSCYYGRQSAKRAKGIRHFNHTIWITKPLIETYGKHISSFVSLNISSLPKNTLRSSVSADMTVPTNGLFSTWMTVPDIHLLSNVKSGDIHTLSPTFIDCTSFHFYFWWQIYNISLKRKAIWPESFTMPYKYELRIHLFPKYECWPYSMNKEQGLRSSLLICSFKC